MLGYDSVVEVMEM